MQDPNPARVLSSGPTLMELFQSSVSCGLFFPRVALRLPWALRSNPYGVGNRHLPVRRTNVGLLNLRFSIYPSSFAFYFSSWCPWSAFFLLGVTLTLSIKT